MARFGGNLASCGRARFLAVIALLLAAALPAACSDESRDSEAAEGRIRAVATVGMVGDLVRGVGGDRVEVVVLIGSGVDPHLHKPTRTDLATLLAADLIVANGLHLEGRMDEALAGAARSGTPVVEVATAIVEATGLRGPDGGLPGDPHLWMDPSLWARGIAPIVAALCELDPAGAEVYRRNGERYVEQLAGLDAAAEASLASVPEAARVLVTAHDAFGYFGARYGFEVIGVQGLSTESEAGVRDLERIVDLLVTRGIPAVFIESSVSPRNVEALQAGALARGHEVRLGGELFSDAMGPAGAPTGNYLGMIRHNVATIAAALGGELPSEEASRSALP